jgi:tripartite-type tricarboxylate transporter receptor subunit TctC
MKILAAVATVALCLGFPSMAPAQSYPPQSYPSRPVRIVVPIVPGGSIDLFARRMGQKMSDAFGQPFIIENLAGASGAIGAAAVARAAPDGYTLMYCPVITVIGLQFVQKGVPYEAKDFTPVMAAVEALTMIVAHPSAPGGSLKELLEYAKRNPGKVTYASAGVGSYFHLLGETLKRDAGVDLLHVPYKGAPQAMTDVASGQVHMTFISYAVGAPFIGRVKALASLEKTRFPQLPDVPAAAEIIPGYEKLPSFFSWHAPAGLPRPILMRVHGELLKGLQAADTRAWLEQNGVAPMGSTPEELGELQRKGTEAYRNAVKVAGLRAE